MIPDRVHDVVVVINETRSRSRAGAHIFLFEVGPIPRLNGPELTIIAQIIKQ